MTKPTKGTPPSASSLARIQNRQGGHTAVTVQRKTFQKADGTAHISVDINLTELPIPERQYVPDRVGVLYDPELEQVRLLFGQTNLSSKALRSLVVITLSPEAVFMFLRTVAAFQPDTVAFMQKNGIKPVTPLKIGRPEDGGLAEPEGQTVAMSANIIALARAGRDATTDFYLAPAASIHGLSERDVLGIDPIVRVEAPIALIAYVMDELLKLRDHLPKEIA